MNSLAQKINIDSESVGALIMLAIALILALLRSNILL